MKVPQCVHANEESCNGATHVRRVCNGVVTSVVSSSIPVVDGQCHVEGGDEESQGTATENIIFYTTRTHIQITKAIFSLRVADKRGCG